MGVILWSKITFITYIKDTLEMEFQSAQTLFVILQIEKRKGALKKNCLFS